MEDKKSENKAKGTIAKHAVIATLVCLVISLFPTGSRAQGTATLFFSPNSGNFTLGQRFSVGVFVQSRAQAMNAFETIIRFPTDKLEVTGFSKTNIITSLFIQEPTFSNSAGTVNLAGVVLNPGYTGAAGKLITINFRAKGVGSVVLYMNGSSVLANDGLGTNILSDIGSAVFVIGPGAPEAVTPVEGVGAPPAPKVTSPTHPDPNKWYANKDPKFEWSLPADINGVNVLANRSATTNPGTRSDGVFSSYIYTDVDDGGWFFHIRLRNDAGWGGITHFGFNIDTEKPERFDIKEILRSDPTDPKARFTFDAFDKTSGIDYYEVKIDDAEAIIWRDDGTHTFEASVLPPGKHTLLAKAFDKAGNWLGNSAEFLIEPLIHPVFTEYPDQLRSGEVLVAKGKTYPSSQVNVYLQRDDEPVRTKTIRSDIDGVFTFVADEKVREGVYKLWAEVIDARSAKSGPSETVTIGVKPAPLLKIGALLIKILAIVIPLIALIALLIYVLLHCWNKCVFLARRLKKEVHDAEEAVYKAFKNLRKNIREQIKFLEKAKTRRELTEEEERVMRRLQQDLDKAERIIKKEIEDIDKTLK